MSVENPRVLVVIPAWNEESAIANTIAEVRATNPTVDILVVDDGSTDRTAARAEQAGAHVARLPYNLGVGGAMRTGYRYALRHGYDAAAQIDADGQHDPRFLAAMLAQLDSADVVIGARFARKDDHYVARGPRRWAMIVLAAVLSMLSHTHLTDVTSGFRVANRRAIRVFATYYPAEYLGDTVESLLIALRLGCQVSQLPVDMRPRASGQPSQSPVRAMLYLFRAVTALGLAMVRRWVLALDDVEPPESVPLAPGLAA